MVSKQIIFVFSSWAILLVLFGANSWGLRVNNSVSMPFGFYKTTDKASNKLKRGMVIMACPSTANPVMQLALKRHYLGAGDCPSHTISFLKPIAATEGDTVSIDPNGIRVNGEPIANTRPLAKDAAGRQLNGIPLGVYRVARDQVWLLSSYSPRSFDSRYIGPISTQDILRIAEPLLTW